MPLVENRTFGLEILDGYTVDTMFAGSKVMVISNYTLAGEHWKLGVKTDSNYVFWSIDSEQTFSPSQFEMHVMKVDGIEDSVIYFEWRDYDVGSGSGSITHSKSLWAMDGSMCYARFVDKCTHVLKDKYGPDASYKTYLTNFYCKVTFSQYGVRITTNNTCDLKVDFPGSTIEASEYLVGKISIGFYYFDSGVWKLR